MKIVACSFSGFKIYPGHGSLFVRSDSRVFRFLNTKSKSLFLQRKKASKFDWTIVYRKLHKKGKNEENAKKRSKKTTKVSRPVVGATLEAIKAKRDMNPAARLAERKKAVDSIKEQKKLKASKKATEKVTSHLIQVPTQKVGKMAAKGFAPKIQAKSR